MTTHWGWRVTHWATFISMAVAIYLIFLWVPMERSMGNIQRIFYFHVPAGIIAFIGFTVVLVGSIGYLRSRNLVWDRLAMAAAEMGFLYCSINLTTGPIWARPVWGIWWTWDARLTLTLVLWLVYVSYLMLRRYVDSDVRRAALSAVMGIFGAAVSFLDYMAIRWWRTQHPSPVMGGGDDSGLEPEMWLTLLVSFIALGLLYTTLVRFRMEVAHAEAEVEYLFKRVHTF